MTVIVVEACNKAYSLYQYLGEKSMSRMHAPSHVITLALSSSHTLCKQTCTCDSDRTELLFFQDGLLRKIHNFWHMAGFSHTHTYESLKFHFACYHVSGPCDGLFAVES